MSTRVLSVLSVAILAAALFLHTEVPPGRLAAQEIQRTLTVPTGPAGDGPTLAEIVLDGPDVRPGEDGALVLRLGGVFLRAAPATGGAAADPPEEDSAPEADSVPEADLGILLHGLARRSIVLGLRQAVAARDGADGARPSLVVEGELAPQGQGGAQFLGTWSETGLELQYTPEDGPAVTARCDWIPPGRSSLVPPLVAIVLAILLRRPVIALFIGVLSAAFIVRRQSGAGLLDALAASSAWVPSSLAEPAAGSGLGERLAVHAPDWVTRYLWPELLDPNRALIIAFVVFMLAMVGVVTRVGGIRGVMEKVARVARGERTTQVAAWLMGLVVFFDDYANTILVGSTMRPLTDRYRIAREKLAYIVDSTAAPVAGLSIFSTWIAFEVSTFSAQLPAAGLTPADGYEIFLQSLPFRFYSILSLVMVGFVAILGRDFGPMLAAERRARQTGELVRPGSRPMVASRATALEPADHVTPRAASAVYPVFTFIALTLIEIARAGGAFGMDWFALARSGGLIEAATQVLYDGSGSRPIAIGAGAGLFVAMAIAHSQGLTAFGEILRAAWTTLRALGVAILILYLAWMIGRACQEDLSTATYLTALVGDGLVPQLLPAILFLTSAVVAFSTGSSWSTMSILLPLVVGLAFTLGEGAEDLTGRFLMVISIGAVLEGAIFGDHCSPISDTTILSSTASASDHIDHVRTQAPYAILTMGVALVAGYLPCAFYAGWSPLYALATGIGVLLVVLLIVGRRPGAGGPDAVPAPLPIDP